MHFGKDLAYLTIFDIQNSGTNQLALGWRVDWHKEFRGQLQLTLPNWQNKKLPNFDDWQISMMVGGGGLGANGRTLTQQNNSEWWNSKQSSLTRAAVGCSKLKNMLRE